MKNIVQIVGYCVEHNQTSGKTPDPRPAFYVNEELAYMDKFGILHVIPNNNKSNDYILVKEK